jgi:hypothetical protein
MLIKDWGDYVFDHMLRKISEHLLYIFTDSLTRILEAALNLHALGSCFEVEVHQ